MTKQNKVVNIYRRLLPKIERFLGMENMTISDIAIAKLPYSLPAFYNSSCIVCNKYYLNDPHLKCILAHEIVHDILDDYDMPDKRQSEKVLIEGIAEIAVREVVDKDGEYTRRFMPQDKGDIHYRGYKIVDKIFQNSGRRGLKDLINKGEKEKCQD